ncbi:hypothetical protein CcCBS67573_g10400 [Chytriomyces confervae]|uniref:Uncharacterized protein n=1 Tax=Chytriomyces confervae TaxID=246404 RepID=A0A507D0K4_9FUNG|nr:hypothetical protein CcCBS67573_g10400 [Chytriomyces confervae]
MGDVEMTEAAVPATAPAPAAKGKEKDLSSGKKRFEVKKWNAVALWAWGQFRMHSSFRILLSILVSHDDQTLLSTTAQSVVTTLWTSASNARRTRRQRLRRNAQSRGVSAM